MRPGRNRYPANRDNRHRADSPAATKFAGAKLVAHELTAQLLSVYPDPEPITFSGGHHTLTVRGERFELIYPGPNQRFRPSL
jgi:hypothetical protein